MANTEIGSGVKIELTAEAKRKRLLWAMENVRTAPFMHSTPWSMSPVAVLMDLGNERGSLGRNWTPSAEDCFAEDWEIVA